MTGCFAKFESSNGEEGMGIVMKGLDESGK